MVNNYYLLTTVLCALFAEAHAVLKIKDIYLVLLTHSANTQLVRKIHTRVSQCSTADHHQQPMLSVCFIPKPALQRHSPLVAEIRAVQMNTMVKATRNLNFLNQLKHCQTLVQCLKNITWAVKCSTRLCPMLY